MASKRNNKAFGWVLVCAQFGLIAVLITQVVQAVPVRSVISAGFGAAIFLAGLALFIATQTFNRPGNWSVHPHPKSNGQLVTNGPYRLIRHPMYTAALMCAAGAALWAFNGLSLACTIALAIVFVFKINIEEREMAAKFSDWREFASRTKRLIPKTW